MKRSIKKVQSTHTFHMDITFEGCVDVKAAIIRAHTTCHYFAHTFQDRNFAIQYRQGNDFLVGEITEKGTFIRITGTKADMNSMRNWGTQLVKYFTSEYLDGTTVSEVKPVPASAVQVQIIKGTHLQGVKGCTVDTYVKQGLIDAKSTQFIRTHSTTGNFRFYNQFSVKPAKKVIAGACGVNMDTRGTVPSFA